MASTVAEHAQDAPREHPKRSDPLRSFGCAHGCGPHRANTQAHHGCGGQGSKEEGRYHATDRSCDHHACARPLPEAACCRTASSPLNEGMLAAQNPREDSTRDARSSPTHATHYARVVAQTAPEVRVARVEAARRALQEGTLTLDGQALADTLLQAVRAERRHA